MIRFLFLTLHQMHVLVNRYCFSFITLIKFKGYGINIGPGLSSYGIPYVYISRKGRCRIGKNFLISNSLLSSISGNKTKTRIEVRSGANLLIGDNVGLSGVTIFCSDSITVGDSTKIGFGSHIYDTDFHSLDSQIRNSSKDILFAKKSPVHIGCNVFIGTQAIVLKGVTIGDNSIIAAGSVVTKNIPSNEIWGGNPAKFLRKI